jgi:hypothetical protein
MMDKEELVKRVHRELADSYDEEMELELEDRTVDPVTGDSPAPTARGKGIPPPVFPRTVPPAGRTGQAAGLGGADRPQGGDRLRRPRRGRQGRRHQAHHPAPEPARGRVAALPAPNDRERTQWYFQRYVSHLPAAGEIVLFDRSWYNRAGVERVMGFCTDEQYEEFFRSVPEFERMLVRAGIQVIKYWFSITDEEQHLRFLSRIHDPLKQWKLSPMDLESRRRWEEYTKAKEVMLERTHIPKRRGGWCRRWTRRRRA